MKARYMRKSPRIHGMSSPVLAMTTRLLARGVAEGRLTPDIDPLRLYVMIAALSQFHLANVHTLSNEFNSDLKDVTWRAKRSADARKVLAAYLERRELPKTFRRARLLSAAFARCTPLRLRTCWT